MTPNPDPPLAHEETKLLPKRCVADVWDSLRYRKYGCENPAKYGEFCGVHSPERQAARAKKRGPTQFDRELTRIQKRSAVVAAARAAVLEAGESELVELCAALRDFDG